MCRAPARRIDPAAKPRGFSLLETVFAATLVAATLVPTTAILREAMQRSREANHRNLLGIFAVQLTEEQAAIAIRNWTNATLSGNLASFGRPEIRYSVDRSDDPSDGGIVNRLMQVKTTVYHDENGDLTLNPAEREIVFRTKVAKLFSYENEPL